ncbi:hypothetical protein [Aeromicrobium sp. PE09-221]|uniref:hypothetical protein n=1 Tax=Aeromicrobium sp. PE09-221 TaxID=1898043 RepID=UPI000B3EDBCC|nr:hypothetical protein [Aeromicrobium sp. PE09-221]
MAAATALAGIVGVALLVIAMSETSSQPGRHSAAQDMNGNPIQFDPGTMPDEAEVERMQVEEDGGLRLRVPSVDLDVPLGSLASVDGEITPPGFTSAYYVRNRGVTPDGGGDGTLVVVTHSLREPGVAPGNFLIDVKEQIATLPTDSIVMIGDTSYAVRDSYPIARTEVADDSRVWNNAPGRLVLITCLQTGSSPAVANIVIEASLI